MVVETHLDGARAEDVEVQQDRGFVPGRGCGDGEGLGQKEHDANSGGGSLDGDMAEDGLDEHHLERDGVAKEKGSMNGAASKIVNNRSSQENNDGKEDGTSAKKHDLLAIWAASPMEDRRAQ